MDNLRRLSEIKQYKKGKAELITDIIVREVSLEIKINGKRLLSIASLQEKHLELAFGFLFTEGLVLNESEIDSYKYDSEYKSIDFKLKIPENRIISFKETGEKTSGCGSSLSSALSGSAYNFPKLVINPDKILELAHDFHLQSKLFKETGGVHAAALIQNYEIISFAEDIGRHNAVDKVIGDALLKKVDLSKTILLTSGRISSEICKKVVRLKIPLLVSHSAPTSEAIRLGWDYKVYIIGFARGKRFNIYTGFDQLGLEDN